MATTTPTVARVCAQAKEASRVLATLPSEARDAALEAMPEGVRLRELGAHRLAGLTRPIALFQVEAEGLLCDFPPLRVGALQPRS
jgi:class 3 adenylate cyclase